MLKRLKRLNDRSIYLTWPEAVAWILILSASGALWLPEMWALYGSLACWAMLIIWMGGWLICEWIANRRMRRASWL